MNQCQYASTCPIYSVFKTETLKNIYIKNYCNGPKMGNCQRLTMRESGKVPPKELLPDGKMLTATHFNAKK